MSKVLSLKKGVKSARNHRRISDCTKSKFVAFVKLSACPSITLPNNSVSCPTKCRDFNSFSKRQNFRLVQIERFCRRQNRCGSKIEVCLWRGRKHCGKRRKCWLPAFSPFFHSVFKSPSH